MISGRYYCHRTIEEYYCDQCGNTFTRLRPKSNAKKHYCSPDCKALALGVEPLPRLTMSDKIGRDWKGMK